MQQEVDGSRIPELTQVIEQVLAEAKRAGATQCEADASLQRGLSATVRLGEVDTVEYQRDRGLGLTVYFGKRKGSASTGDLSAAAVRATVEKACAIARFTAEDECSGLADAADLAQAIPDLDLYHRWDLDPDQAVALARDCEAAGMAVDKRLTNSEGASVSNQRGVRVYGNSHGFLAGFASSSHSISCVLLAQQGDDMQRDFWYSSARDPADLEDAAAIGRRAGAERDRAPGRPAAHHPPRAGHVHPGDGPRPVPQLHRCHPRRQPVPQDHVPARGGRAGRVPGFREHRGAAPYPQGAGQQSLRRRGRGDPRPAAGAGWRGPGLRARQLLRAQAGTEDHRQCRWGPQSVRALQPSGPDDASNCCAPWARACWSRS